MSEEKRDNRDKTLGERVEELYQGALEALGKLLSPPPTFAPIPVRRPPARRGRSRRRY